MTLDDLMAALVHPLSDEARRVLVVSYVEQEIREAVKRARSNDRAQRYRDRKLGRDGGVADAVTGE